MLSRSGPANDTGTGTVAVLGAAVADGSANTIPDAIPNANAERTSETA